MKYTSHIIAGATTGMVVAEKLNYNPMLTVGMAVLGAIMVDIDEEHSFINKILFPVPAKYRNLLKAVIGASIILLSTNVMAKYLGSIVLLSIVSCKVSYKFSLWSGLSKYEYHRTIFHDPIIGLFILSGPLFVLSVPEIYAIPYIVGLLTHYLMDSFTSYGLPLYLLGGKRLRMPLTYNSRNQVVEYIILVGYVALMFSISPRMMLYVHRISNILNG